MAADHQDQDPSKEHLLVGPSMGWDENVLAAWVGRRGMEREVRWQLGQPRQAVLPDPIPQELPGRPMVWSQAAFLVSQLPFGWQQSTLPLGQRGLWGVVAWDSTGLWKEDLLQPDHWQLFLPQDSVEPCWVHSSLRQRRPSACSHGCNLSFCVSVPPGADAGRQSERSGNSMSFFQGLVFFSLSCLHSLSFSFSLTVFCLASELI